MTHENVTFNENGTVSANPRHILEFVPEQSVSDHETDRLILPNIALLVSHLKKNYPKNYGYQNKHVYIIIYIKKNACNLLVKQVVELCLVFVM